MKITLLTIALIFIVIQTQAANLPTHKIKANNPKSCSTCHFGIAKDNQTICFQCHTNQAKISILSEASRPTGIQPQNIEAEYQKRYHHPTTTQKIHSGNETLPETNPNAPRHADCVDCHDHHDTTQENKLITTNRNQQIPEHELCYRCHGDSANLPGRYTNKKQEFSISNQSFHPVEAEGKNSAVISLIKPFKIQKQAPGDVSTLTCSSCHASDNPSSPRGPHGSQYEGILTDHYSKDDNQLENQYAYALCYRCHKRDSILGNESFKFHSLHIQGSKGRGTSCYTCHNSHGSRENKYLLKFNPAIVSPNKSGQLKFMENGNSRFSGRCFLSCHGVDHNPKTY